MSKPVREKLWHLTDATLEVRAEGDLPPGIAGRVSGVALTYEVVDSYGTMFARKCAKRSIDGRVAARKVPLLMDHERTSKAHVGVVTSMADAGDALVMTADVFDTAEGRAAMEYVKAVLASGASTGFSIGFIPRASEMVTIDGKPVERFTEIELREVSITPMPAVPGAEIASARNEAAPDTAVDVVEEVVTERTETDLLILAARVALDALSESDRHAVLSRYQPETRSATVSSTTPVVLETPSATASTARYASLEERTNAVRSTFTV
jgi:HK97 family phage prohead protease